MPFKQAHGRITRQTPTNLQKTLAIKIKQFFTDHLSWKIEKPLKTDALLSV